MKRNRRNGHVMLHLLGLGVLATAGAYVYYNYGTQISTFLQNANEEVRGTITQLAHNIQNSFPK
jgi:hypothetical protein